MVNRYAHIGHARKKTEKARGISSIQRKIFQPLIIYRLPQRGGGCVDVNGITIDSNRLIHLPYFQLYIHTNILGDWNLHVGLE